MGYRSDVCIVTRKATYEDLMVAYTERFGEAPDYDEVTELGIDGDLVRIDWYDVKWYPEFKTVHFIAKFLYESAVYYEFLRIGEESDDIEYEANVPDDEEYRLYCARSAEVSI